MHLIAFLNGAAREDHHQVNKNIFTHQETSDKNSKTFKNIQKGYDVKITLDLDDTLVKSILDKSLRSLDGLNFNEYVSSVLIDHMSSVVSDESIMAIAIARVESLNDGQTFTLKELMMDKWESIENPKSFGREFKKRSTHTAQYIGVTSSNKALYKKYTYQAPAYLVDQNMAMNVQPSFQSSFKPL
ncbi:MAG: DUF1413 domain-containing protein [Plesiomonas shigelloides]